MELWVKQDGQQESAFENLTRYQRAAEWLWRRQELAMDRGGVLPSGFFCIEALVPVIQQMDLELQQTEEFVAWGSTRVKEPTPSLWPLFCI